MRTILLALAVLGLLSMAAPARADSDPACFDADTGRIHIGSSCKFCPSCPKDPNDPREMIENVRREAFELLREIHEKVDPRHPPLP